MKYPKYHLTDVPPDEIDMADVYDCREGKADLIIKSVMSVWDEVWYRKLYRKLYNFLDWLF
tara:strand:+ start:741 stop:923 length:183 start_codon:yes stop_codon:yes gene_type:complete